MGQIVEPVYDRCAWVPAPNGRDRTRCTEPPATCQGNGGMPVKSILERIQAMERELPSLVTVIYPDGTQTAVEALKAFEIAVHNKDVTFTVPGNQSMETLLRAVADAVADDE